MNYFSSEEELFSYLQLIQEKLALGKRLDDAERELRYIIPDDSKRSYLFQEFAKRNSSRDEGIAVLVDRPDGSSWYAGPSLSPFSNWQLFVATLKNRKDWTDEMILGLDQASSCVVSKLSPPKNPDRLLTKGLVLGYVQSGKTTNFSAVIAKAADAGYRMVIVLSGMHNNLRLQTETRLAEDLYKQNQGSVTNLTSVDLLGDFSQKLSITADRVCSAKDGFSLAVLKKNGSVLRNFNKWLEQANPKVISDTPVLFIDDESDQASINTNDPDEDPTTINALIRAAISRFKVVSYVGYTATPFANVLVDAKIEDDLFPKDFLISLEKPAGYFGAEELFGSDIEYNDPKKAGLPVIRIVPDSEASAFSVSKKKGKKASPQPSVDDLLSDSTLREAIDAFLIGGAIRLCRGQWRDHITMLIHTTRLVSKQRETKDAVERYIKELQLDIQTETPEVKARLHKVWLDDFTPVSATFKDNETFSFETVWLNIAKLVMRLITILDNSNSDERLKFERINGLGLWGIVIGGNTLSRGLTIEGLTTSYYVRDAKGYDTLLQMGRWFGYRPNYIDLTRIYMTMRLKSHFFHLATVEEELREEIKTMAENNERPIDVGLTIRSHPSMTITNNLKLRNAKSCALSYSGYKLQARNIRLDDKEHLKHNFATTQKLIELIQEQGVQESKSVFADFEASVLFRGVKPKAIIEFLGSYQFSQANVKFMGGLLCEYIEDLVRLGELDDWSVAIISIRDGQGLQVAPGLSVNMVDRSTVTTAKSDRDPSASYLRALSPPEDELIDLGDIRPVPLGSFVSKFRSSFKENRKVNASYIRHKHRPTSRGLLLLYPINPNSQGKKQPETEGHDFELGASRPVRAAFPVIGVTLVFPKTARSKKQYNYVTNGTV